MSKSFPLDYAVPGVMGLRPYQPGKPIEELERELGVANAIKLASNENAWGCSPLALAALREVMDTVGMYPDANGFALKKALSRKLGVSPNQLTLGNGSNDVLDLLARVFVGPGEEVVFSQHAFLVYALVTRAVGGTALVTAAKDWGHDLEAMGEAIGENTKMVFIANPNNPTGTYAGDAALRHFLQNTPEHVVVVVDEAYFEYVQEPDYPNCLGWLPEFPNLVVTRTFSKIYGLANLRIGYAAASESITDLLNRVRQPFNANGVAQSAALAALDDPDHVTRCAQANLQQLKRLQRACDDVSLGYIPSVANFLSIEVGAAAESIYQQLLRKGIIVRPVANYEMPHHLRVTIGREPEMDRFIDALKPLI